MNPQTTYPLPESNGSKSKLLVTLSVLLLLSLTFGGWAFWRQADLSKTSTANSRAAAQANQRAAVLQAANDKLSKQPYKVYTSSATYGSISFNYPKAWSAYVDTSGSSQPIDGYFYPDVVPSIQGNSAFALRVELSSVAYSDALSRFDSDIKSGKLSASAYVPAKLAGQANVVPGLKLTGNLTANSSGTMVIMKVRDKTLKVYTESPDYQADFDNIILPSLTFAP